MISSSRGRITPTKQNQFPPTILRLHNPFACFLLACVGIRTRTISGIVISVSTPTNGQKKACALDVLSAKVLPPHFSPCGDSGLIMADTDVDSHSTMPCQRHDMRESGQGFPVQLTAVPNPVLVKPAGLRILPVDAMQFLVMALHTGSIPGQCSIDLPQVRAQRMRFPKGPQRMFRWRRRRPPVGDGQRTPPAKFKKGLDEGRRRLCQRRLPASSK